MRMFAAGTVSFVVVVVTTTVAWGTVPAFLFCAGIGVTAVVVAGWTALGYGEERLRLEAEDRRRLPPGRVYDTTAH
jgi:hypothetical protein